MVRLGNWSCFSCWGNGERKILSLPAQVGWDLVFWVGLWGLLFDAVFSSVWSSKTSFLFFAVEV